MQLLLARDIPLPLILSALALILGVTAEISSLHARLLPASLIAAIFTLSPAGNMPIWEPLLIYALGTLWYGLFNWFWFWLWREQPLRESLSLLYRELANYCEAKYSLLTQHTDPTTSLPPLLTRQQKVVDLITQCYQQMHMLAANQRSDHKRLLRAFRGWAGSAGTYFSEPAPAGRGAKTGGAQPCGSGHPLERADRRRSSAGAGG